MQKVSLNQLSIILVLILLTACTGTSAPQATVTPPPSSSRLSELQATGQIVIGTAITRPFEYRDEQTNELIGFDVDLMTEIVSSLGIQIVWREMAFADLLPELQAGNLDAVIAGMYITTAREELVDMSNPYLQTGLVMATHGGITDIATIQDLVGRTVGVKEGSTGERYAISLRDEQGIALELQRYTDTLDSLDDLDAGLVDVVFNDYINTLEYIKTHPNVSVVGEILQPAGLGISVQAGDADLLNFINSSLATLEANNKIQDLFNRWINPETQG
ncbi:MAG TPA: ABC transporter substrate-binding protein [Aggregatilineales bacterium]|nr:ABC transporter substrate-binding protein [Aggregatilineales bacterium]